MNDFNDMMKPVCLDCGCDTIARMCKDCCLDPLLDAIRGLKNTTCWCEMGKDNPMVTSHTKHCKTIHRLMGMFDELAKS